MFSIIDDIMLYKKGDSLKRSDFDSEFNMFMIERWLSMYSDLNVEILNSTVNILYKGLDKEQAYKLLMVSLPKLSRKCKPKYIKSVKSTTKKSKTKDESYIFVEGSSKKLDESMKIVFGDEGV